MCGCKRRCHHKSTMLIHCDDHNDDGSLPPSSLTRDSSRDAAANPTRLVAGSRGHLPWPYRITTSCTASL